MELLKEKSEGWYALLAEIADNYADGTLITHEWMRNKLGLAELNLTDFDTLGDFLKSRDLQQFAYMSFIDSIRWQLLENENMYLRSVRGDGYVIMNPNDQTEFGYNRFMKEVKKAIKEADLIMNKVKQVSFEQQQKDNDLKAKFSIMQQMLSNIKK